MDVAELEQHLPGKMKRDLARKHAGFYIIDAKLAQQIGLGKRTNNILQGFFALTKVIPWTWPLGYEEEQLQLLLQEGPVQKIVDLNDQAVDLECQQAPL